MFITVCMMGIKYRYKCKTCDYETVVSGGPDQGMRCTTRTITCNDCHELSDIVVSRVKDNAWVQEKVGIQGKKCPKCQSTNVRVWGHQELIEPNGKVISWKIGQQSNNACPKCGGDMVAGEAAVYWD